MYFNKYFFLSLLFIFLNFQFIIAQSEVEEEMIEEEETTEVELRKISLNQLVNEMLLSTESEYILTEAEIMPDEKDIIFQTDKIFYTPYIIKSLNFKNKSIYFYDCIFTFPENSPLEFEDLTFNKFNFVNCWFDVKLSIENCRFNTNYPVKIHNCTFTDNVRFVGENSEIEKIEFINCTFNKSLDFEFDINAFLMKDSKFIADTNKFLNEDEEYTFYQLNFSEHNIENCFLKNCEFNGKGFKNLYSINFEATEIGNFFLEKVQLETINFTNATISKSLLIDSLKVSGYIGVRNFDFPFENSNVPWHNIKGEKFCIFQNINSSVQIPYQPKTDEAIANEILYNDLISAYNKFNAMYHTRGDITSANGSYIEIKDIETRRQKYLYQTNPSFNIYLNYKLNVFLKYFSDYATNPARSLIVSLYVIMIFGVFYFFTFSEWDGINYKYFIRKYKSLAMYFMSEKSLQEFYFNEIENEYLDFSQFKKQYLNKKNKIPFFIRLFGAPLYGFWMTKHRITIFVYKKIEILGGTWDSITISRKISVGLIVSFLLFLYFLFIILIKCINAFFLSLNMFIIIGFGLIPEKGLAMYLGIIEAFIGWFLLTIFTITLLSQILQSA